ncbi:hypothetical protein ACOMHN_013374 [Nucella lapillus]
MLRWPQMSWLLTSTLRTWPWLLTSTMLQTSTMQTSWLLTSTVQTSWLLTSTMLLTSTVQTSWLLTSTVLLTSTQLARQGTFKPIYTKGGGGVGAVHYISITTWESGNGIDFCQFESDSM